MITFLINSALSNSVPWNVSLKFWKNSVSLLRKTVHLPTYWRPYWPTDWDSFIRPLPLTGGSSKNWTLLIISHFYITNYHLWCFGHAKPCPNMSIWYSYKIQFVASMDIYAHAKNELHTSVLRYCNFKNQKFSDMWFGKIKYNFIFTSKFPILLG